VILAAAQDEDAIWSPATFRVATAGWPSTDVPVREIDDDCRVLADRGAITVPEGGSAGFTVRLAGRPSGDKVVTVARLSGDADLTVQSGANLTFTPANWNVPQTATLAAAIDNDAVDGQAVFRASTAGYAPADVTATEGDSSSRVLVAPAEVRVPEGGTATFTVRLSERPLAAVTVTTERISGDTDLRVAGGASLLFTPDNWDRPQPIALQASHDSDAIWSTASFRVSAPGWELGDVTAMEVDDDTRVVVDRPTVAVPEGGTAMFTVSLGGRPNGTKVVTVSRVGGDSDLTVQAGASLVFTPTNWSIPQTVTLAAATDPDATNGTALFRASTPGWRSADVAAAEAEGGRILTVGTSPAAQGNVGQLVTVTATAAGFTRPQYKLWIIGPHHGGPVTWITLGAYSDTRVWNWTPDAPGSYQLQAWVRESGSTAQKDLVTAITYQVTAPGATPSE
jgi:hypothetical protein